MHGAGLGWADHSKTGCTEELCLIRINQVAYESVIDVRHMHILQMTEHLHASKTRHVWTMRASRLSPIYHTRLTSIQPIPPPSQDTCPAACPAGAWTHASKVY